jgi:hypothetical protein
MKTKDVIFIIVLILFFLPFFVFDEVFHFYETFNKEHGMITSFIKFGVLATLGEVIALRIRKGVYRQDGFGILPRAMVWGFLGMTVFLAFKIFASGTPVFLQYLGMENAPIAITKDLSPLKALVSFSISTAMNLIYAPVLMTTHKITDEHIVMNGGTLRGLFKPIDVAGIFKKINWDIQWHFVFKKTIPLFWIPAHTITFLLPPEYQVLFAALLSVALGIILSIASLKSR